MTKENFEISTDKNRLQVESIHKFLSEEAYWCKNVPIETVRRAIENSICFGLFEKQSEQQIGFARIVTDHATFAWLADVYVEKEYRGKGLSKYLMTFIMKYPALQGLRRIALSTQDAHGLYEKFGFTVTKSPQNMMEIKNNNIYS